MPLEPSGDAPAAHVRAGDRARTDNGRRSLGARILTQAPVLLVAALVLAAFALSTGRRVLRPQPADPWEAVQYVEAWRTTQGLPVYEPPPGHATHMYGALTPVVLGAVFRLTGPSLAAGRMVQVVASILLIVALTTIVVRGAPEKRWLALLVVTMLVGLDSKSYNYFAQARPDMLALLVGLLALVALYRGYRDASGWLYALGLILLVTAFFIKQTALAYAVVPFVAIALERRATRPRRWALFAVLPLVVMLGTVLVLARVAPTVFHYMVSVPKQYPISMQRLIEGTLTMLVGFPLFIVLVAAHIQRARDWRGVLDGPGGRLWLWSVVAVVMLIPPSALAFAKAGGTDNSFLPAMLAIVLTCGLALREYVPRALQEPLTGRRARLGVLLAILMLLSYPKVYAGVGYLDHYADYPTVVQHVARLPHRVVLAPEDPTITMYAGRPPGRSLYLELDASGWPTDLPPVMRQDLAAADAVVDVKEWWQDALDDRMLAAMGFTLEADFPHYAVWQRVSPTR